MAISLKHAFANPKADGPDSTVVQPGDWNDEHVVTMATAKLLGRATASTGAAEEISLGTGLSFAGTTLNAAGGDGTPDLDEYTTTTPSAPLSGATLFSRKRAGRVGPAFIGATNRAEFQPFLGTRNFGAHIAAGNTSSTINNVGLTAPSASGSSTGRSTGTSSLLTSVRRIGYVIASAAANQPTGWAVHGANAALWRGNAAGLGGFFYVTRFGFNAFTGGAGGNRCFVGLAGAAWTSGDPSALTNIVGVGFDSADSTFYAMSNDGSGTATRTTTGITIAADKLYEVRVFAAPNASQISVSLERLDDGALFEIDIGSDIPSSTTSLLALTRANSGSSATTGASIDIVSAYLETDY